jgi:oligopeptide transport system substrate-binding protein
LVATERSAALRQHSGGKMRLSNRGVLSWLAVLVTLILVATACGGDTGQGDDQGSAAQGGSFTMGVCEPEFLVPQQDNETCGGQVLHTLFTPLVLFDAETSEPTFDGAVGESIETEDQKTWTVKLKDGWTFHDGSPVTAQSFVDAWNWGAYGPNLAGNSYFFENVEGYDALQCELNAAGTKCVSQPKAKEMTGLEVVDDLTLDVTLVDKFSQFPLTVGYNAFYPLPESFFDDPKAFNEEPIGNGPYQMDGPWQHNQSIKVTKFEDYAGDPGNADSIEFKLFGAEALDVMYRDLQGGNIDLVDSVPPEQIEAAKAEFGDRFVQSPSSSFTYLGFPTDDPRFADPDIRHAFSMAIDRQTIIDKIFFGTLTEAKSVVSPVVKGSRADPCGEVCTYDPDKAKQLLEQAGGWQGPLTLWFNNDGGHEEWMEAVSNQLRQNLGIQDIKFESFEFSEYLAKLDAGQVDGPFRLGWVMDYPSPQNYLQPIYSTTGSSNNFSYSNKQVDSLIDQGNAAPSIDEGIQFYNQAEDLILQDMPVIPLWFGLNQVAHSDTIDNVVIDAFSFARLEDVQVVQP